TWTGSGPPGWRPRWSGRTPRWWRSAPGCRWRAGRLTTPMGSRARRAASGGWAGRPFATTFAGDKVLDRPAGRATGGPGQGRDVAGYRIHHGRVRPEGD